MDAKMDRKGEVCPASPFLKYYWRSEITVSEKCVISEPRPDFGWIVNSRVPNDWQSAFRILVASEPELLAKREGNFWDSGKVVSAQSTNVIYAGKPLASGASYWWCVNTWNKDGKESGFSAPQRFNTGEFNWVKRARGRPWIRSPGGGLFTANIP